MALDALVCLRHESASPSTISAQWVTFIPWRRQNAIIGAGEGISDVRVASRCAWLILRGWCDTSLLALASRGCRKCTASNSCRNTLVTSSSMISSVVSVERGVVQVLAQMLWNRWRLSRTAITISTMLKNTWELATRDTHKRRLITLSSCRATHLFWAGSSSESVVDWKKTAWASLLGHRRRSCGSSGDETRRQGRGRKANCSTPLLLHVSQDVERKNQ